MSEVLRAIRFAHGKHQEVGQRRKWSGAPYIVHPIAVSRILMTIVEPTNAMLVAAILHDTVEDTNTTLEDIKYLFGKEVADLVYWLTDVAVPEDGNRAKRMQINRDHIAQAPSEAQTIKAADIMHNIDGCVDVAGKFAMKYIPEQREKFKILTKADPRIMAELDKILSREEQKLIDKKKLKS